MATATTSMIETTMLNGTMARVMTTAMAMVMTTTATPITTAMRSAAGTPIIIRSSRQGWPSGIAFLPDWNVN